MIDVEELLETASMRALRRPAWIPRLEPGDGATGDSKIGGEPTLAPDETHPVHDGSPIPLLLQVRLDEIPELDLGSGLLQVFYAPMARLDDWEPWTPNKIIRVLDPLPRPPSRGIAIDDYWTCHRIVGWQRIEEVPDPATLGHLGLKVDHETEDALFDHHRPRGGIKIGGWPCWLQGEIVPRCDRTGFPCRFVAQFDSQNEVGWDFASNGMAYLFQSPAVPSRMTLISQR